MCSGNLPDPNDRAYYSCLEDIKNYIGKAKRALQLSVVNQENAAKILKAQQKLSIDFRFYFRPYLIKDPDNADNGVIQPTWIQQTLKVLYYGFTKSIGNSN